METVTSKTRNREETLRRADVRQYLETALWSSTHYTDENDSGTPMDDVVGIEDCSDDLVFAAEDDLDGFCAYVATLGDDIYQAMSDASDTQVAHDFWLSRNCHGAGFFDGDYDGHEDSLQEAARTFGSVDLYIGDDGKVYGQ